MLSRFVIGFVLSSSFLFGAESGPPARVTTIAVPNGGHPADAKITSDGTIHLLYNSGDIPYYVKSTDQGAAFSAPIPVVDQESRKPGLEFSGWAMAVGNGGAVHVAMITNNWKVKLAGVPEGMVFASLFPPANAFTPARSLNGPGWLRAIARKSVAASEKRPCAAASRPQQGWSGRPEPRKCVC